MTIDISCNA